MDYYLKFFELSLYIKKKFYNFMEINIGSF